MYMGVVVIKYMYFMLLYCMYGHGVTFNLNHISHALFPGVCKFIDRLKGHT